MKYNICAIDSSNSRSFYCPCASGLDPDTNKEDASKDIIGFLGTDKTPLMENEGTNGWIDALKREFWESSIDDKDDTPSNIPIWTIIKQPDDTEIYLRFNYDLENIYYELRKRYISEIWSLRKEIHSLKSELKWYKKISQRKLRITDNFFNDIIEE